MEKDLDKILVGPMGRKDWIPASEWLRTQPEAWREIETEALHECMKRGWSLTAFHIQMIAREIDAERNPKGW